MNESTIIKKYKITRKVSPRLENSSYTHHYNSCLHDVCVVFTETLDSQLLIQLYLEIINDCVCMWSDVSAQSVCAQRALPVAVV